MTEDFSILSVKLLKKGVLIGYYDNKHDRDVKIEDYDIPHPDFYKAIQGFKEHLAKIFYIPKDKEDRITIKGFAVKSDTKIVIKGTLTTFSDKETAINSDPIDLEESIYGFENELQTLLDISIKEAKLYLSGEKRAQGKLDFDKANNGPTITDEGYGGDQEKEEGEKEESQGESQEEPQEERKEYIDEQQPDQGNDQGYEEEQPG